MRAHGRWPMMCSATRSFLSVSAAVVTTLTTLSAQAKAADPQNIAAPAAVRPRATGLGPVAAIIPPPEYVIGPNDSLSVLFWRDKDMSTDVVVRPDGNITLPLLNDIHAAGLTPEQLRERILVEARRYIEDPSPTVVVKEINSRKVFITGQVEKPGTYPISGPTTVLQLIAIAGGLREFADGKNILVMRTENGRQVAYSFDYRELLKRKNLHQNIDLKPGDTVVVP
jgi:polysaccharide export outer membrane protein